MVCTKFKSVSLSTLTSRVVTENELSEQENDGLLEEETVPTIHLSEPRAVRSLFLKEFWQVKPEKSKLSYELNEPVDSPDQLKPELCFLEQVLSLLEGVL